MDAKFSNDEVGASAYDPRVMLKIVPLACSQGLIASRAIKPASVRNDQFIAISGDSQPSHAHMAKFVSHLGQQIKPLFAQVLMTFDAQGPIGREVFAIDGVKVPSDASDASKERSGSFEELRHRAARLEKAADKIVGLHRSQNNTSQEERLEPKRQARIKALRKQAQRTRQFVAGNQPRLNQSMLLPMIEQSAAQRNKQILITADAGYNSEANVRELMAQDIPAWIADNPMRSRDERFNDQHKHHGRRFALPAVYRPGCGLPFVQTA